MTLGAEGALLRGEVEADVAGARPPGWCARWAPATCSLGVVLGRLAPAGFDPSAAAAALEEAVSDAARATERWGAIE